MHQGINKFVDQLKKAAGGDKTADRADLRRGRALGVACRKRSCNMAFQGIIDVHEGMMGGANGPGWIKSGLPVAPHVPEQAQARR